MIVLFLGVVDALTVALLSLGYDKIPVPDWIKIPIIIFMIYKAAVSLIAPFME